MIFFIGGCVRGQYKGVQNPQPYNQHKHQPRQPYFAAEYGPDGKCGQKSGKPANQQEKPGQVPTNALVRDLNGHGAIHGGTVYGHGVLPQRYTAAVPKGQQIAVGIVGRQRKAVPPPGAALHLTVKAKNCVLVRYDVIHHTGGTGQFFAGIGVSQYQFQFPGRLISRQIKFHADSQQIFIKGENLTGGLAVRQNGGGTVIIADGLGAAFAQFRTNHGQPHQQRNSYQNHEGNHCPQQRFARLSDQLVCSAYIRHTIPPDQSISTPKAACTASFQRPSISKIFCTASRTAPSPPRRVQM